MEETTGADQRGTSTSAFGVGRRENHDASAFYSRFPAPVVSDDDILGPLPSEIDLPDPPVILGDARSMTHLPDRCVALVVTSPPYFVGKEYEQAVTDAGEGEREVPASYIEYLEMLRDVFAECVRVLEPGGRIAVNVANLGRKPYRSLSADVIRILQDDLGLLLRGEIIWQKAEGAGGSVAWGSFRKSANPVLRDLTERVIVASKGRFDRARSAQQREKEGYPHASTMPVDEFMEATLDVWRIDPESARRVNHPAPFPIPLAKRLIDLYSYENDLILDPFVGSGTTLVAAERSGRRSVGYDLEQTYVDIAAARLETERNRPRYHTYEGVQSELDVELFGELTLDERREHFQARATSDGKKAQDLALATLESAGFQISKEGVKLNKLGIQVNFEVLDVEGRPFFVDVSGAFTTARPGLIRTDTLWKTLGRAHVLYSAPIDSRLLILTSNLPHPGSPGDRALRAVGPASVFDAIEMFDPAGRDRLAAYAQGSPQLPGFWTDDDLAPLDGG
jgi:site-specific DNA-methyltransferase (adenine-specific)